MKTRITFATIAVFAVALCAAPAYAQASHPQHTAKVPFAFTVGDVQLPAGNYAITQFGNRMQVRSLESGKAAIITALPNEARITHEESALHFERKGEGLILSNVYFGGTPNGVELLNKKVRAASRMQ